MIQLHLSYFLSAVRFITIIPVGGENGFKADKIAPYFPAVGLLIGLGLFLVHRLIAGLFPPPVSGGLDLLYLCVITGAFHLDGLGDAADGLFSHRQREQALEIMKDSRVGMMGLVTVFICLLLKWSALSTLPNDRFLGLIVVPALARSGVLFGMKTLPYGRPEGGTGKAFFESPLDHKAFAWTVIPVGLSLIMGKIGILLLVFFVLLTVSMIGFFRRQVGCITGDMLGAMVEVNEMALLALLCISFEAMP